MKGLKIVKNIKGIPVKAIINLDFHSNRWGSIYSEVINENNGQAPVLGIQYMQKENIVELDLPLHEELLEDFYDGVMIDELKNEERIPWNEVKLKMAEKWTSKKAIEH
jgi:hypothetical protein